MPGQERNSTASVGLPPDVQKLFPVLNVLAFEATPITALSTNIPERMTFCLRFSDGQHFKLRSVTESNKARRMQYVRNHLDDRSFARIFARHRNCLLEEWVDGVPLDRIHLSERLISRCGSMLGEIHTRRLGRDRRWVPKLDHDQRLTDGLHNLRTLGILSYAECDRLWRTANLYRPESAPIGFVHRDLCAENLVLRGQQPCSIDNANLSVGCLDEDLARTWYRWPMNQRQWTCFLGAYAHRRSTLGYFAHAPYWAILVLVRATLFRHRAQARDADYPLNLLTGFLANSWPQLLKNALRVPPECYIGRQTPH